MQKTGQADTRLRTQVTKSIGGKSTHLRHRSTEKESDRDGPRDKSTSQRKTNLKTQRRTALERDRTGKVVLDGPAALPKAGTQSPPTRQLQEMGRKSQHQVQSDSTGSREKVTREGGQ